MGAIACLLFGIISAWIALSLLGKDLSANLKPVLFIGLAGGTLGLSGILIGWGDLGLFNLYNVLLSICFAAVLMLLYLKLGLPARQVKAEQPVQAPLTHPVK